ncbi:hypothetical protein [Kibdelosporangium phytohabitans]|uniref:hypothetical protein n=1 Tax=Kibdelosporangium phytohabitans TaxID=860235 RepID=UPI001CEF1EF3|nr:hypothetical protein [Kibdelosporangium phytohabitans]
MGHTQESFAIALGVDHTTVSRWERAVLVDNSVAGSGLGFYAAGRYSLSNPPRRCRRRIVSIRAGNGIVFGSSLGARRSIPSPWWLRPAF